ncbi:methylmalonyl Co-A mutase-associated GTPase MeaB, partial [Candidatus Sumerlaeota bacterium]|nr:methylmalonyl Co-A mutase-associated GTPase MeaB [Candidatus Sumerlaeota bacterium]
SKDPRALAARLTRLEVRAEAAPSESERRTDPRIVGLTGPGGTGKSTMIDSLIAEIRRRGGRAAALCVDPSSARSGGAFLGDRIRMQRHAADPDVFIRSVGTRGAPGGVPACVAPMAHALRDAGYDWVLIESVGAGQDQVEIRRHVGQLLFVTAPGQGDAVQAFKSSALEVADLIAVTRADQGKAEQYAQDVKATLRATRRGEPIAVMTVSGERGSGIAELLDQLSSRVSDIS